MKESCVVLLSSGLDSTVNLYEACESYQVVSAVTIDYGQRAEAQELVMAQKTCAQLSVPHKIIDLTWMGALGQSALVDKNQSVPTGNDVNIFDLQSSQQSAKAVWVPNRNGVFLNIGACIAESLGAQWVVPGFNIEEAATFSDNTQAFANSLDKSFSFSTSNGVKVKCFTMDLTKAEIFARAIELKVNLDFVWPCYFGGEKICGECESCLRFLAAKNICKKD